jgi:hypothetical protein
MFYVYILRSEKTGRRYVGSCEDLDDRVRRHNAGEAKATRHGIPWNDRRVVFGRRRSRDEPEVGSHREFFDAPRSCAKRERYYETGRGRDELDPQHRSINKVMQLKFLDASSAQA